jgi:hypothetical protein
MSRRLPKLVLLAVFVLAFAVACGGNSGTKTAASTKPAAASTALPFKATFSAPTHSPVANKNWPIAVIVTDLSGKPIAATLQMNVLFAGARVGQIDNGKIYHFVGRHHEIINWPLNAVGHPLTLQSVVKAKGKTQKLLWAISVAKK